MTSAHIARPVASQAVGKPHLPSGLSRGMPLYIHMLCAPSCSTLFHRCAGTNACGISQLPRPTDSAGVFVQGLGASCPATVATGGESNLLYLTLFGPTRQPPCTISAFNVSSCRTALPGRKKHRLCRRVCCYTMCPSKRRSVAVCWYSTILGTSVTNSPWQCGE